MLDTVEAHHACPSMCAIGLGCQARVQKLALTSFSTSCALLARPVERSEWDNSEQSISPDPSLSRLSNLVGEDGEKTKMQRAWERLSVPISQLNDPPLRSELW